jgi:hypothetical protein
MSTLSFKVMINELQRLKVFYKGQDAFQTKLLLFFFFFLVGLEFELHTCKAGALHLSHIFSAFCSGYFGDGDSRTICPAWP